jgi:hypothetical protein
MHPIEMLEARLLLSTAAPISSTASQRAIASYTAMQTYLYRTDGTSLYHEQYPVQSGDNPYSYVWPLSQAYNATVDVANLGNYQSDLQSRAAGLAHYYSSNGTVPNKGLPGTLSPSPLGYDSYVDPPLGGSGDKYYDDNDWIGLASIQQYQQTGDTSALARAQTIFTLITSGWDSNASHPDPGGVFWTQSASSQDRNTVSNMPAAELGLELYQATRNPFYLNWATRMYDWVYTYMRDPSDGLFWDHVNLAGQVNTAKWSYNQGTPIGANVLFYEVTGNPTYLQRAQQIANAAISHYGSALIQQPVSFNAIFLRNLLMLYQLVPNPAYAAEAANFGQQIWTSNRDASTGLFHFGTNGITPLLDQAAAVQVFSLLADTPVAATATVTNTLDSGPGSLRDAIANPAANTIQFAIPVTDPNYDAATGSYTILLASQLLINRPLAIVGPGANVLIISGNGASRVFEVSAGVFARINGVTITDGHAPDGAPGQSGGGIENFGVLLLDSDLVSGNTAGTSPPGAAGGTGGGIENLGILSVYRSAITGNSAGAGGSGGGIDNSGSVTLVDSTLANNMVPQGAGGGLFNAGLLALVNDTIVGNVAATAAGIFTSGPDATLYNTIVAANHTPAGAASDIAGTLDSSLGPDQSHSSNNLIGTGGSGGLTNGANANFVGVADPKLAPLSNYGGPTPTIALLASSPALNHGSNALAAAAGLITDQRGFARVFNGVVDIGAYEAQLPTLPGDVNHDGVVNFADLLILAQHYGSPQPLFELGDLDGDGLVGFSDLLLLAQHYGAGTLAATVTGSTKLSRRR